jgi:predicted Zn-dependent protease
VAFAAKGQASEARASLTKLETLAAATPADAGAGFNQAKDVLAVALASARAHIALADGKMDEAVSQFRSAVAAEDTLAYDEPEDWFLPVRHELGALLLKRSQAADAERIYRDDLIRHPNNGWALFGLAQALTAQKKTSEAAAVEKQFAEAWKRADVKLAASVF